MMSWTKFHRSVTKTPPSEVRPYKFIPPSFSWALPHSTRYGSSAADRPQIQLTRWPGNSPDLNPIQTVWAWMKKRWKIKNAPTRSSGRPPYCWSGSRGPGRWTSWRTCWWGCRQGCRRWLPGRVAWPDIKLIVKKRNICFFNFYIVLSLLFCTTSQYFPRPLRYSCYNRNRNLLCWQHPI